MLSTGLECVLHSWNTFVQSWNALYRVGIPMYRFGIPFYRVGLLSRGLEYNST
jgi:hypothetical protein